MKHFLQIAQGIDTLPVLNALAVQPELWNANSLRTSFPNSPHAQAEDIWLFFNEAKGEGSEREYLNDLSCIPYPAWNKLPQIRSIIFDLMRRVEGVRLGRVVVTKLAPGSRILPHVDQGAPAEYYSRYQVALLSSPGVLFRIGQECVNFRTGDAWWIDNRSEHSVENNSSDDRIVAIVDIRHE